MKRALVLLLSFALLLAASGCASNGGAPAASSAGPVPEPSTSAAASTQQPPQNSGKTPESAPSAYDKLLETYRLALSEQWDGETLLKNDLSLLLLGKSADTVGYCLLDVDGDGSDELLVGACTGEAYPDQMIFDLYTLDDGVPFHVFSGQERDRYYLYQDEAAPNVYFFYNENSSSAFQSGYLSMHLDDEELDVDQAVLYDAQADSQNPWFSGSEDDGVVSNDQPMEESLAQGIIASYQAAIIRPPFTPFH